MNILDLPEAERNKVLKEMGLDETAYLIKLKMLKDQRPELRNINKGNESGKQSFPIGLP